MFGYRDPMRDRNSIIGGNGMATLGKGIFYALGGMFLLGALGSSGGFGLIIIGLIIWALVKGKK